jgi:hypothetical protein
MGVAQSDARATLEPARRPRLRARARRGEAIGLRYTLIGTSRAGAAPAALTRLAPPTQGTTPRRPAAGHGVPRS